MKELLLGKFGWEPGENVAVGSGYAYIFKSKKDVDVFCKTYLSEECANTVKRMYGASKTHAIRFEVGAYDGYVAHYNPIEDYKAAGLEIIEFKASNLQRSE